MSSESNTALVARVPPPPTTFHPFPKLPYELRIKIWDFAANEQRTITVAEDYIGKWSGDDFVSTTRLVKHNARSVPAILHISDEARSAALRHYELYVSPRIKNKGFYINFATDTLAIESWSALLSLYDGLRETQTSWPAHVLELEQKLKFLHVSDWTGGLHCSIRLLPIIRRFWRLEELIINALPDGYWNEEDRLAKTEKVLCDGWAALGSGEHRPAITWVLEESPYLRSRSGRI